MKKTKVINIKYEFRRKISVRNSFFHGFILFISFLFASCTESFHFETEDAEPKLVVYGVITNEYKRQKVRLTNSAPYFDPTPSTPVSGAKVKISGSDKTMYDLYEDPLSPGDYISDHFWLAKTGTTYLLDIETDFDKDGITDHYQASTTIPAPIHLDSIQVNLIAIMGHTNYALNIFGQDSPEEDYYLFHVLANDTIVTNVISKYIISDDALFNGQYINGLTIHYFDHFSEWEKDSEDDRKTSVYLKPGDLVNVFPSKIEKGYYDFISQCNREQGGENPMFGGPSANIITNITNGGVGYFTGYNLSRVFTEVEK
ncbi:MAG: DUF4249 domain-containing protein [Bacteroidales bacterium]|nr:DUF4249 domain-containing protein [Bacteroidales bacterium]